jgi:P27 family predicted phage terminase small subunit
MAGRPRKPVAINKKHFTKEEREQREAEELQVPFTDVKPPSYLNKDQKKKFKDIANKLVKLGIMTELDVDCLARYVQNQDLYLKYTEKIMEELEDGEASITILKEFQNFQSKAFQQAQSSARDLGLTITSRCKIVLPPTPEDDDDEL